MKSGAGTPPTPPDSILGGVGPGDYHAVGRSTVSLLERWAGLGPSDDVLDVGCGPGRTAWALSEKLGDHGSFTYTGLDVVPAYIEWSLGNLGLEPERFRFHLADIRTSFYNPGGATAAEDFVFPWADASFDLAIATSLFTHLLPGAAVHYLSEIARILRPGGRLFASFFLLDARGREAAQTGFTYPTFSCPIEHGLLHDAAVPESGVAHDEGWLLAVLARAGLQTATVHPGGWKSPPGEYHQDIVVAVRAK
jgi:SAM-dependent methyltransferase